jgi:hypothetical protein
MDVRTVISLPIFSEVQVASAHPTWVDGYVTFAFSDDKAQARLFNIGPSSLMAKLTRRIRAACSNFDGLTL